MKTQFLPIFSLFIMVLLLACSEENTQGPNSDSGIRFIDTVTAQYQLPDSIHIIRDTLIDSRDGRVYKTVTLGEQTWMAENLVPHWYNYGPDLFDERFLFDKDSNNIHLGGFFPWNIAMGVDAIYNERGYYSDSLYIQGICPDNYHIPSPPEWEILFQTISDWFNLEASAENGWEGIPKILRDTNYTYFDESQRGVDLVGFTVLEAGYMDIYGGVQTTPQSYFWTRWNGGDEASVIRFWTFDEKENPTRKYSSHEVISHYSTKILFVNVRCVKD